VRFPEPEAVHSAIQPFSSPWSVQASHRRAGDLLAFACSEASHTRAPSPIEPASRATPLRSGLDGLVLVMRLQGQGASNCHSCVRTTSCLMNGARWPRTRLVCALLLTAAAGVLLMALSSLHHRTGGAGNPAQLPGSLEGLSGSRSGQPKDADSLQKQVDALVRQVSRVKAQLKTGWVPSDDPGTVFLTGYSRTDLAAVLYPGVPMRCYTRGASAQATKSDILIVGMHGPTRMPVTRGSTVRGNCNGDRSRFPGKVLHYNAEPCHIAKPCRLTKGQVAKVFVPACIPLLFFEARITEVGCCQGNHYYLGPLAADQENSHEMRVLHMALTTIVPYIQAEGLHALANSHRLIINDGTHFMAYAHSNCEKHREKAFAAIVDARAQAGLQLPHAVGACFGHRGEARVAKTPRVVGVYGKQSNLQVFLHYKFVLAMENAAEPGYISEKLFVAFVCGVVPVYWGTKDVFDVFNRDAFLFWNDEDPQQTIRQLQYLDSNRTAYRDMLAKPFLADGQETVDKYFSYGVGGALWKKVRKMMKR
jgi:hypothetical protein